jgi:hypothetical protein
MRNFLTALLITLVPLAAAAETPEEKGLAIIQEADKRDTGWVDAKAELEMVLKNKQGHCLFELHPFGRPRRPMALFTRLEAGKTYRLGE